MIYENDNIEGLDSSILTNPSVLKFSGHESTFTDPMVDCRECKSRWRADTLDSDKCPGCGSTDLTDPRPFNLMFKTSIGPVDDGSNFGYLRPETAQQIFINFKNVLDSTNKSIPFGIAQIGKAFRNEITPRNFIFRVREFEQMELEFFVKPGTDEDWHQKWLDKRLDWWEEQGNGLMADIGDSQSIENELSTYSSKLTKMNYFLNAAYDKTLVLIDEFGSGSDPDLGSSMAQVFLMELNKSKTYGVMTTHYNSIKALASELPRVDNGSMQFNSSDLTPEYVLNQGVPGSSYTYEVAQKVGVTQNIIDQARGVLDESTVAIDRLLVGIQKEKNELSKQREKLSERLDELESLKEKQGRKIALLEDKVRRQSAMNEQQNAMITWGKISCHMTKPWQ